MKLDSFNFLDARLNRASQMYTELLLASFVVLRWSTLEADVGTAKRLVTHVVVPFVRTTVHHVQDLCCKRGPKPGMRPPPLVRPSSTETNDANSERASSLSR